MVIDSIVRRCDEKVDIEGEGRRMTCRANLESLAQLRFRGLDMRCTLRWTRKIREEG